MRVSIDELSIVQFPFHLHTGCNLCFFPCNSFVYLHLRSPFPHTHLLFLFFPFLTFPSFPSPISPLSSSHLHTPPLTYCPPSLPFYHLPFFSVCSISLFSPFSTPVVFPFPIFSFIFFSHFISLICAGSSSPLFLPHLLQRLLLPPNPSSC